MKRLRNIFLAIVTTMMMFTSLSVPVSINAETNTLQEMYDSLAYKALEYLGYDSTGLLKTKGWTFNSSYVGASLYKSSYWSTARPKNESGNTLDYVNNAITPATKADVYKNGGTNCSTYVQYYIFGYYVTVLGYSFPGLTNIHYGSGTTGFASVVRIENTLNSYISSHGDLISKVVPYNASRSKAESRAVAATLQPGDMVAFSAYYPSLGSGENHAHFTTYVGYYNGEYYFAHSGAEGRGPELVTLTALESGASGKAGQMRIETAYRILDQKGTLTLNKTIASDAELLENCPNSYSLAGAEYAVYDENSVLVGTFVTDADGVGYDKANPANAYISLNKGDYFLEETKAPEGYYLDTKSYDVTIESSTTVNVAVKDTPILDPLSIVLTKTGYEDVKIAGAQFTMTYYTENFAMVSEADNYTANKQWVFETDNNGIFKYNPEYKVSGDDLFYSTKLEDYVILAGTYVVEETLVPANYVKAETFIISIDEAGNITYLTASGNEMIYTEGDGYALDEIKEGYLYLTKTSTDPDFEGTVAGAEYTVYTDADCTQIAKINGTTTNAVLTIALVDTVYKSATIALAPGTYYVKETKAPAGFSTDIKVHGVTVEEAKTATAALTDDTEGYVDLLKTSSVADFIVPLTGAVYSVYTDADCTIPAIIVNTETEAKLTVKADGTTNTVTLKTGTYYIKETQAPDRYSLDKTVHTVVLTAGNSFTADSVDSPIASHLTFTKKGEALTGVTTETRNGYTITVPVYSSVTLSGVTFTLYADGDIKSADGSKTYFADGAVIEEITTDANGVGTSSILPLGNYILKEKAAPTGYVLDETEYAVVLDTDGATVTLNEATGLVNKRQKAVIEVNKSLDDVEDATKVNGILFGLYAKADIANAGGETVIAADTLVDVLEITNGYAASATDIPFGSYYVKELETLDGYVLDKAAYDVTFNYTVTHGGAIPATVELSVNDGNPIVNTVSREVNIRIIKFDEDRPVTATQTDGDGDTTAMTLAELEAGTFNSVTIAKTVDTVVLAGTEFTLFDAERTALAVLTTDENGQAMLKISLGAGTYTIEETKASDHYTVTDKVFTFTVNASYSEQLFTYGVANKGEDGILYIKENLHNKRLAGCKVAVYNSNGDQLATGVTDDNGMLWITSLPAGTYTWKEIEAPSGYAIDKTVHSITIETGGGLVVQKIYNKTNGHSWFDYGENGKVNVSTGVEITSTKTITMACAAAACILLLVLAIKSKRKLNRKLKGE